jgi:hypothetical protein
VSASQTSLREDFSVAEDWLCAEKRVMGLLVVALAGGAPSS